MKRSNRHGEDYSAEWHSGNDALTSASSVVLWVKCAEHLEYDYTSVSLVLPSNGEDIKKAALAVLDPRTTVCWEDLKLYRVQKTKLQENTRSPGQQKRTLLSVETTFRLRVRSTLAWTASIF